MKFFPYATAVLLLLAACAGPVATPDNEDDFVAGDVAPDASPGNNREQRSPRAPLSSEEEGEAALLVAELESAADQETRDTVIERIIKLGPRYLPFLRGIESDEAALDLMYIVRRIERAHDVAVADNNRAGAEGTDDTEGNDAPKGDETVTVRTGGEDGPSIPDYAGDMSDYDRVEVEKFLRVRLTQAERMLNGGRFDSAIRIAEAAIILMPDSDLRPEFDALILKAKGVSQAELLIAGTLSVSPETLRYERREKAASFEDPLQIDCFLKNVSSDNITLRLYEGEGKESLLELAVTYEQLDYQGNVMSQRGNVRLPIDAGDSITLLPNESYALSVPLEGLASLDSDAPLKNALGRARIEAVLRVYGANDAEGDPIVIRPVRFPKREVLIFPSTYDLPLARTRPLTAVRDAIREGGAQELFMSAHMIGKRDRRAAGDELFKDFDKSALAMKRARLKSLSVIFDVGRNWDIARWREWWDENRLRQ